MTGPKIPAPEPCGYAHRYSPRGLLHALRDNRQDAEDDAAIVGGSAHVVSLYDDLALETYAAARAAAREAAARMEEQQRTAKAVHEAVSAIYFADSSDYRSALWSVVRLLAPDLAELLETDESLAWKTSDDRANAKPAAIRAG